MNLREANNYWNSAIHSAVQKGQLQRVKNLVEKHGVPVNIQNNQGITPLMVAANNGKTNIVRYLIRKGANVRRESRNGKRAIHNAARYDHVNIIRMILSAGEHVNTKTPGNLQTPLHIAAQSGAARAVKFLIDAGANIHALDNKRRTPLLLAVKGGVGNAIRELVKAGAVINERVRRKASKRPTNEIQNALSRPYRISNYTQGKSLLRTLVQRETGGK